MLPGETYLCLVLTSIYVSLSGIIIPVHLCVSVRDPQPVTQRKLNYKIAIFKEPLQQLSD